MQVHWVAVDAPRTGTLAYSIIDGDNALVKADLAGFRIQGHWFAKYTWHTRDDQYRFERDLIKQFHETHSHLLTDPTHQFRIRQVNYNTRYRQQIAARRHREPSNAT